MAPEGAWTFYAGKVALSGNCGRTRALAPDCGKWDSNNDSMAISRCSKSYPPPRLDDDRRDDCEAQLAQGPSPWRLATAGTEARNLRNAGDAIIEELEAKLENSSGPHCSGA